MGVIPYRKLSKRGNPYCTLECLYRIISLLPKHTSEDNPVLNSRQEIFIPVKGFEGLYEISNLGRLRNARKIMKTYLINSGYPCAKLVKDGERTSVLIHRLVAQHFLNHIPGATEVNHKNQEKIDNSVDNLEWVTSVENKAHSYNNGWTVYNKPSTGIKLGKSSKFHNVLWDKARSKWVGVVRHQSKNHFAKRFDLETDAAQHVNWILDQLGLMDRSRNLV